jgi:hypothetical protein
VVDGIYRKTGSFASKSKAVSKHNNRAFDCDKFLFQTENGVIDTVMMVASASAINTSQEDLRESIGTVELRVYLVRLFGEEHSVGHVQTYNDLKGPVGNDRKKMATYKTIAPDCRMTFDENCVALTQTNATKNKKKMDMPRPGKMPWAIFRFHYRSRGQFSSPAVVLGRCSQDIDAIEAQKMGLTHSGKTKLQSEAHVVKFDPVPALEIGTKPKVDDVDASTIASSSPVTPLKSAKMSSPAVSKG